MVSLVVVNVACLGGVNVAGDRCGVRVVVGRGGGRGGRGEGDQASLASFLICRVLDNCMAAVVRHFHP